jgi:hypothetical protein
MAALCVSSDSYFSPFSDSYKFPIVASDRSLFFWLLLKGVRLVHKRPEGEVAAAGAPKGKELRRWR